MGPDSLPVSLKERLLALQNDDGGWGTTQNRPSNTEATALAAMAFAGEPEVAEGGLLWLRARQRSDGSWPWTAELDAPSWTTGPALIALRDAGVQDEALEQGLDWLVARRGWTPSFFSRLLDRLAGRTPIDIDPTLEGWPWTTGAFSWIEPTSMALMALKMAGRDHSRRERARIEEAEGMILDRECPGGGWNSGNTQILGVDQEPYPDTTALALLGLQGKDLDSEGPRSFQVLERLVSATGSGLALAWAVICFRAYGLDASPFVTLLSARFTENGFFDETRVLALAAIAARPSPAMVVDAHA